MVLIPLGDLAAGGENRVVRANVLAVIENHYVRPIDREQLAGKTIDAMLAELDPYCEWIRPDEADRIRQAADGRNHGPRQPTVRGWYNAREEKTTDWCDEDAKIGYLRIDAFGADTPREVRAALFRLVQAEATGVVLDLRANHGGLLAAGVEVADLFVAEGPIVYVTGRGGERQLVPATEDHTNREMPIVGARRPRHGDAPPRSSLPACRTPGGRSSAASDLAAKGACRASSTFPAVGC